MKAFTLIETVVYVALLALLMGSTLLVTYQILQSSSTTSAHDAVGMEGDFVLRKLAWVMSDAESVLLPSAAHPSGAALKITRYDGAIVGIDADTYPGITFKRIVGPGELVGIEATVTLSGKSFYFKKYLEK